MYVKALIIQCSTIAMIDKFISVYGQKIHYVEAGSGTTVILLHHLGGDLSDWDKTIPMLSTKHHVIAFDQIGTGQSDKPFINYRPATWVDFLNRVYEELKISSASLVGHSMGGVQLLLPLLLNIPKKLSVLYC